MQPDPARVADTRPWFTKARDDLRAAAVLLAAQPPLTSDAVFHCQQAAEKAMKGFLAWNDIPFRKTHDLSEIGGHCMQLDPGLEDLCRRGERLTVFAWAFRYPGEPEEPPVEEAREALDLAREVYQVLVDRMPIDVRPAT